MSRKRNNHIQDIEGRLAEYAERHTLDFHQYSEYHMRLMDGGFTVLDIWTTGRYYMLTTDYLEMVGAGIVERGGEKGFIPEGKGLEAWLDKLFFPEIKVTRG